MCKPSSEEAAREQQGGVFGGWEKSTQTQPLSMLSFEIWTLGNFIRKFSLGEKALEQNHLGWLSHVTTALSSQLAVNREPSENPGGE